MKKIALLMALTMVFTAVSIPSFAEEAAIKQSTSGYYYVEANGAQAALSAMDKDLFIQADGLYFKDLNKNGALDIYEDYRNDSAARVADLVSQLSIDFEAQLLFCNNTAGQFSGTYPVTNNYLYRQDCPFEPGADEPNSNGYSAWYYINVYGNRCFLDNANGTPEEQVFVHNAIQQMCEEAQFGIPMTFTCDREYNSWGGFVDKPHDAFGVANDPELAEKLLATYAKAMQSVGIHVTFEPYGNEIGSFNGEDPEYIAKMAALEVGALEQNGLASCTKHWIGRGGDSSFGNARSTAQNIENWLEGWKAAIGAGCEWIMTNDGGTGLTNTVSIDYDSVSMNYLRDELGFDGIIVTDWWSLGQSSHFTGITPDGEDLGAMNGRQMYKKMLENGVTYFGTVDTTPGEDIDAKIMSNYPDCIINGVKEGDIDKALVDAAVSKNLKFKFDKGLFDNPYCDAQAAMELACSAEYLASAKPITTLDEYLAAPRNVSTNEQLKAARNPEDVALDEAMQASSAVLVKNEDNLLPLAKGTKVYVTASNDELAQHYAQYIAAYGTVVETMEEADVLVGDFTAINDVAELFIDDAKEAGKPIVMSVNCVDPTKWAIDSADALLYLSFNQKADHGSQLPGFITTTEPWVYADLLFGEKEPTGMIVKELSRSTEDEAVQWKDLAGDQGVSAYVRLMLEGEMLTDENHSVPHNWSDAMIQYQYGMKYGERGSFTYRALTTPMVLTEVEVTRWGSTSKSTVAAIAPAKVGEPYNLSCLMINNGGDDMLNVQAKVGDTVIGEKLMAINGGDWRVLTMDVVFDAAGEQTVSIGDLSVTITVE